MTDDELIKQYFMNPNIKGNVLDEEINHLNQLLNNELFYDKKKASKTLTLLLGILLALHIIPLSIALGYYEVYTVEASSAICITLISALVFLIINNIKPSNIKSVVTVILIISLFCQYYLPTYLGYASDKLYGDLMSSTLAFFRGIQYGVKFYSLDLLIFVWIPWLVIWLLYCSLSMQYKQYYK